MKKINVWYIVYFLFGLILIGLISTSIYCWINYGGKPVSEIPAWALWFMFKRN